MKIKGETLLKVNDIDVITGFGKLRIPYYVRKIAPDAFAGLKREIKLVVHRNIDNASEALNNCNVDIDVIYTKPTMYEKRLADAELYGSFISNSNVRNVKIPNGYTSIPFAAFANCKRIKNIKIPKTVTEIDACAFDGCKSLESIDLPDTVASIGYRVFNGCENLKHIKLPSGLTEISISTFAGCKSLESIDLPGTVTNIGWDAFRGCVNLKHIKLPDGLTEISSSTFAGCKSLESIDLPDTVTRIGHDSFAGCKSLESIDLPDTVARIGYNSFAGCENLKHIKLPSGLTEISISTFAGCESLESIDLPGTVTNIGWDVFRGCVNLKHIKLPDGLTEIGKSAFDNCKSLESMDMPDAVASIGHNSFAGCENLKHIKLPSGLTEINSRTFAGCKSLESIDLPDTVTSIGEYAFSDCENLKRIRLPSGLTEIGKEAFDNCESLESIEIPDTVTSMGEYSFRNFEKLKHIKLPSGLTEIKDMAFRGCESLESIDLPDTITSIGEDAFRDCVNLKHIKLPSGLTEIKDRAFIGCESLESIEIPNTVTSIGEYAFNGCENLKHIKLPSGLTEIKWETFNYIQQLERVEIPENIAISREDALKLYYKYSFDEKNIYPLIYGKDAARFDRLRSTSLIENSVNYTPQVMAKLYYKMYNTIGMDAMERMLHVTELNNQDVLEACNDLDNIYSDSFSKRYQLTGALGETNMLLKNLETYLSGDKKTQMKVFQMLNSSLVDEVFTLEDIFKRIEQETVISEELKQKIVLKSREINKRRIEQNLQNVETDFNDIYNELNLSDSLQSFSKRLITQIIKDKFIVDGNVSLEHVIKEIESADIQAPALNAQRDIIITIANRLFDTKSDVLNHNIIDDLKSVKQQVGQGWIRKVLQINPSMNEEELDKAVAILNSPRLQKEQLESTCNIFLNIKEGVDKKQLYRTLENKNIKGIVSYVQVEQMFGGMQEPYSHEFKKWFVDHQQEILSNPKCYLNLSVIHNSFDEIIDNPTLRETYINGGITVEHMVRLFSTMRHVGEKPEEREMGDKFDISKVQPNYFPYAQKLFKEMRARTYTKIPQIEPVINEKYRGRIRRMDDPNVMFDGNITNCCQVFGNVGEAAMLHAAKKGAIFVVERLEEDGTCTEVGQSWVWRNKDRICFDNIELPISIEENMSQEEYRTFISVYKNAAQQMLQLDDTFLRKQLQEGKIDEATYENYRASKITVGMGYVNYNLENVIREEFSPAAEIILPEEYYEPIYGGVQEHSSLYSDATTEQYVLAESEGRKQNMVSQDLINEPTTWYGNQDEVEILSGNEINWRIEQVKRIEQNAYRENQIMLQNCQTAKDIADSYGLDQQKMKLATNKDGSWYIIYQEGDTDVYIADLAMINGVNSQNRGMLSTKTRLSTYEAATTTYQIILDAAKNGKNIKTEATKDTSLLNLKKMQEKKLITILSEEEFNDGVNKSRIEFSANVENMENELETLQNSLSKAKYREKLKGVEVKER